jgi:hypothetical protein
VSDAEKLVERLSRAAEAAGDDQRAATFARGLVLGALVGAAIAGSTIWQRRHGRQNAPGGTGATPSPGVTPSDESTTAARTPRRV